jgi:hypothetical protein
MGVLAQRLTNTAVRSLKGGSDTTRLDEVFAALGNVRGLQLAAEEAIGQVKDDANDQARKAFSWASGNGLGAFGIIVPGGMTGAVLWTALSTGWSSYDTYKSEPKTEVDKVREMDDAETLGRRHAIAQSLLNAGLQPVISPQEYQSRHPLEIPLAGPDGRLRPFADIMKSGKAGMKALDRWLIANGLGKDKRSLGGLTNDLAANFDGQKSQSKVRAPTYS